MCSSPKGRGGRVAHSSAVNSMSGNMSAAQYSNMVQRSNESYERRQKELAEIRAARKLKQSTVENNVTELNAKKAHPLGFMAWFKNIFLHQHTA